MTVATISEERAPTISTARVAGPRSGSPDTESARDESAGAESAGLDHLVSRELPNRFVLRGVPWQVYEDMLAFREKSGRRFRITYTGGDLEVMGISHYHEAYGRWLSLLISTFIFVCRIPSASRGTMTFQRRLLDKGIEPDECYWLANQAVVRNPESQSWATHLRPDLVVEVEVSRSVLDRLGIYAAMGVPEVWRFDGTTLTVLHLSADGTYQPAAASAALPGFPVTDVPAFVARIPVEGETAVARAFAERLAPPPSGGAS